MKTLVVLNSKNIKLGPGVVSTRREVGPTCPKDCPLFNDVCYAQRGRMAMSEKHVRNAPDYDNPLAAADGAPLVRHLTGGDWLKPTKDGKRKVVDREHCSHVFDWHDEPSQRHSIGWGYTHAPEQLERAGFGPSAFPDNLEILASCHTLEDARRHQANGWRTARVIDEPSERAKGETLCPYDLARHQGKKPSVTCASCRLCMPGVTNKSIAFIKF